MRLLFFYSSFSLIPIKIYHHLHVQPLIFCLSISTVPYSFLLPSSLLLYSLPIHESLATTNFLSTISQIPPSHKFHHHWSIKSPSPVFFFSLFSPFFALSSLIYDLIHRETETAQARHWSLTHFATKRNSSVKDTVAGSENFHQWRRQRRLSSFDCRSWKVTNTEGGERKKCLGVCLALTHPKCLSVCPIQFMILVYIVINFIIDLVDLGCGFVPISLVVFFFEVVLVDVGSCQWWLSVLLQ